MKFKFEKLIIWQKAIEYGYEYAFNLMNMMDAFKEKIK